MSADRMCRIVMSKTLSDIGGFQTWIWEDFSNGFRDQDNLQEIVDIRKRGDFFQLYTLRGCVDEVLSTVFSACFIKFLRFTRFANKSHCNLNICCGHTEEWSLQYR